MPEPFERPSRATSDLASPLLHPIALASIAVLLVNDHVLKAVAPGPLTGKLSDLAGLIFFPLLLASLAELALGSGYRRIVLATSITATLLVFAVVKSTVGGAEAVGLALGAVQWVVMLGPLRDAALVPAVVVADKTDLLVMPVSVIAWWIGAGRRPPHPRSPINTARRQSAAASAALIVAGLASMATSQVPATVSAEVVSKVHLTTVQPVAVRHVTVTIETHDPSVSGVSFAANVERTNMSNGERLAVDPAIDLILSPDPGDGVVPARDLILGRGLDATVPCQSGCTRGVTLIARLRSSAEITDVEALLTSSVYVEGAYGKETVDARITMTEDVDRRFDGGPPTLLAAVGGTMDVGTDHPIDSRQIELRIDAATLTGPLEFPLVGRLSVRMVSEAASRNPYAFNAAVAFQGGDLVYGNPDGPPIDHDWLAHCKPREVCIVKIELGSEYQSWLNAPEPGPNASPDAPVPTETQPGFVKLRWTVEAVLEAFDGRSLPPDGLVLSVDDRSRCRLPMGPRGLRLTCPR